MFEVLIHWSGSWSESTGLDFYQELGSGIFTVRPNGLLRITDQSNTQV